MVVDPESTIIEDFVQERRDDGIDDPTIRRDLVPLRAMFRWALKKRRINHLPVFDMPPDAKAAGKYITPAEFAKIHANLPNNLRSFFAFMYSTGCRLGAARVITWKMVTRDTINIPAGITKNDEPLTLTFPGLLKMFRGAADQPVFDDTNYRPEWNKAVAAAGFRGYDEKTRRREEIPGYRIHDLRCSGAINMLDAGNDEGLVMKIGGWKTRAMLDRYNRPTEDRIRKALQRTAEYVDAVKKAQY